jgi:glycosyltransferase involved in cell wall biosynthesis
MKPIRVLNVVAIMDRGGLETMIMNHYRVIHKDTVQFDFLVHREKKGAYDDEIRSLGGVIFYLPHFNPLRIQEYNNALDRFFEKNRNYEIIHAHYNALSMWVLRSAKKHNVRVRIAHSHLAFPKFNHQSPFFWYARMKINNYCNYRFACSKDAAVWLFGKKYSSLVEVFRNAIPAKKFEYDETTRNRIRNELGLKDCFVIGHIGRFNSSKNHEYLIRVFHELYRINNSAYLLLIGDGEKKERIENLAIKIGVKDRIRFLGVRNDVSELLQAMDVFVFPSKFEALPVTLVEAQSSGLRIIASDSITKDITFTNLVTFKSLNLNPVEWAIEIQGIGYDYSRTSTYMSTIEAGYDIYDNARFLTDFYISALNNT